MMKFQQVVAVLLTVEPVAARTGFNTFESERDDEIHAKCEFAKKVWLGDDTGKPASQNWDYVCEDYPYSIWRIAL